MSILICGKTECPLCGQVIYDAETAVGFPAFVYNDADPLLVFNDAAMHSSCVERDPKRQVLEIVLAEFRAKTGLGNRKCVVCRKEITDPDDYLLLPRLVDDKSDSLHQYNYTHLHKTHVRDWNDFEQVVALLRDLAGCKWKGPFLNLLITQLEEARVL